MANGENSICMEFFPLPTNPPVPPLTCGGSGGIPSSMESMEDPNGILATNGKEAVRNNGNND